MNDSVNLGPRSPVHPRQATVHVDAEGIRFGDVWFSHDAILQRATETSFGLRGERASNFFARKYREWVASVLAEGSASSEGAITPEMIREAEGHLPLNLPKNDAYPRWQAMADFLNRAVANPNEPCPCCNVTPAGDVLDHLPSPPMPSASTEGAEAIAQSTPMPNTGTYFPKCDNCGQPVHMHAPPSYLCPQPAQGEHEQRSCEGSERRPIADEVVRVAASLREDATMLLGLGFQGDGSVAANMERAAELVESAHPRGLSAGGYYVRMSRRFAQEVADHLGPENHEYRDRLREICATAEQPSCGQDARDAARYRSLRAVIIGTHPIAHQLTAKDPTTEAEVDAIADEAIAAQQRQGGGS